VASRMDITKRGCLKLFAALPGSISKEIAQTTDEDLRTAPLLIGKSALLTVLKVSGTLLEIRRSFPRLRRLTHFLFVQLQDANASGRNARSVRKVAVNNVGLWETRDSLHDIAEYKSLHSSFSFNLVAARPCAIVLVLRITGQAV
jgi:hypothetical protein